jgi:hypothetical protein
MKFLWMLLFTAPLFANKTEKPQVLRLPKGPVKEALMKHYKLHLADNFYQKAEQEIKGRIAWTTKPNK